MTAKHLVTFFLVLLNITLAFKLIWGEQGILAHRELKAKSAALEARLADVSARQQRLSDEIRLLRSDAAHMENIVRSRLNYVKDNEVLYMFPEDFSLTGTPRSGAATDEAEN
jgi:cell division protein FtsB